MSELIIKLHQTESNYITPNPRDRLKSQIDLNKNRIFDTDPFKDNESFVQYFKDLSNKKP